MTMQLEQGSIEWHEHRAKYLNASEAGAAMGVNPWSPNTFLQLYNVKKGITKIETNAAMQRGIDLEPLAREIYEERTGHIMQPDVMVKGSYSASLDGITMDGSRAVEIKCPMKGVNSDLWKSDRAPDHYAFQLAHQCFVSGVSQIDFVIFDGESDIKIFTYDESVLLTLWDELEPQWLKFGDYYFNNIAPPPTEKDVIERNDEEWLKKVAFWKAAKSQLDKAKEFEQQVREDLIALTDNQSCKGGGVNVTRVVSKGNVNYKKIPELNGVDLDSYRAKEKVSYRITESK